MNKNKLITTILTVAGAGLFVWMIFNIGPTKIFEICKQLSFLQLLLITCTFFVLLCTITLSFRRILAALGYKLSFKYLYPLQLIKFSISYITPFLNSGGEPVLIYLLLKRNQIPVSQATAATIIERVMRLTQILIFVSMGLFMALFSIPMKIWAYPILLGIFAFLCWSLWAYYAKSLDGTGFFKYMLSRLRLGKFRFFKDQHNSHVVLNIDQTTCKFIKSHPADFWTAFCFSIGSTAISVLQVYFVMNFLGWNPNILEVVIIFATMNAIGLIPIPASLGTSETGIAALFAAKGIGAGSGLVFSLIMRVATVIAIIPGLMLLPYFGLTIKRAVSKNITNMEMEKKISLAHGINNLKNS